MAKQPAKSASDQPAGKREFYVISLLDRSGLDCVEKVDIGSFKDRVLNFGGPFAGFPPDCQIWLKRGKKQVDLLGGGRRWKIVSNRFVEAATPLVQGQAGFFPVPMFDVQTKEPVHDYQLLHVPDSLCVVATIDGKLRIHFGTGIVYDGAKIPSTTNIFRMGEENARYIVVSGELRSALQAAGVKMLEFLETSTI